MNLGPLIIISGPSGCGKSTLIERLLVDHDLDLRLAVSVTTRRPRPGEVDGVHYHFWTREQFSQALQAGAFLEWADVFGLGNCYGTLRSEVEPFRAKGKGVLLEIDVNGRKQVVRQCPEAVSIFVRTSTPAVLEARLRKRGTDQEEAIQRRLREAATELAEAANYDHQVINDELESAVAALRAIVAPLLERRTENG
jgi:guanylate kinase